MNDLKTIQKINSLVESDKQRKLAVALNNPGGHAKSAEKGCACKRESLKDRLAKTPVGACPALDKMR